MTRFNGAALISTWPVGRNCARGCCASGGLGFRTGHFELWRRRWRHPRGEVRRVRRERRGHGIDDERGDFDVLRLQNQAQLFESRLKRDAIGTSLSKQLARRVLVLELKESGQTSLIDDLLPRGKVGVVGGAQLLCQLRHREATAAHAGCEDAIWFRRLLGLTAAGGGDLTELVDALDSQRQRGRRRRVLSNGQLETLGEQRFQHLAQAIRRRLFWRQRRDVEAVPFDPARPSGDPLRQHAIGGTNQVHHRGVADFITGASQHAAAHARLGPGADRNARNIECRTRSGGLAQHRTREKCSNTGENQQALHWALSPSRSSLSSCPFALPTAAWT
jgi:hypothetical protein